MVGGVPVYTGTPEPGSYFQDHSVLRRNLLKIFVEPIV